MSNPDRRDSNPPAPPNRHILRLSDMAGRRQTDFLLEPDAAARAALAQDLGVSAVRKLRFQGTLEPVGRTDWRLSGTLGATVVQACVVTLAPVTTRIDEAVRRIYMADLPDPAPGEVEMPEDDAIDPLPQALNLNDVLAEALSLALPTFPRAPGAVLDETVITAPGIAPMTQEAARPFAGLDSLRKSLEKKDDTDD